MRTASPHFDRGEGFLWDHSRERCWHLDVLSLVIKWNITANFKAANRWLVLQISRNYADVSFMEEAALSKDYIPWALHYACTYSMCTHTHAHTQIQTHAHTHHAHDSWSYYFTGWNDGSCQNLSLEPLPHFLPPNAINQNYHPFSSPHAAFPS